MILCWIADMLRDCYERSSVLTDDIQNNPDVIFLTYICKSQIKHFSSAESILGYSLYSFNVQDERVQQVHVGFWFLQVSNTQSHKYTLKLIKQCLKMKDTCKCYTLHTCILIFYRL